MKGSSRTGSEGAQSETAVGETIRSEVSSRGSGWEADGVNNVEAGCGELLQRISGRESWIS